MGVDRGISCRPSQILVLSETRGRLRDLVKSVAKICNNRLAVSVVPVGNVLVCPDVPELLSQPEVDGVDEVALLAQAHEEVVRLDVSVDKVLTLNEFNAADL